MSALRVTAPRHEHARRTIHRQLVRMPVHALVEFVPDASPSTTTLHHGRVRIGVDRIDAELRLSQMGRRGVSEPRFSARESLVGSNEQFLLPMQAPVSMLPPAGREVEFRDFVERPLGRGTVQARGGRGGLAIASNLRASAELTVTIDLYEAEGGHRFDLLLLGELKFLAGALLDLPAAKKSGVAKTAYAAFGKGEAVDGDEGGSDEGEPFTVIEAGQAIRFHPRMMGLEGGAWGEAEVRFRFGEPAAT